MGARAQAARSEGTTPTASLVQDLGTILECSSWMAQSKLVFSATARSKGDMIIVLVVRLLLLLHMRLLLVADGSGWMLEKFLSFSSCLRASSKADVAGLASDRFWRLETLGVCFALMMSEENPMEESCEGKTSFLAFPSKTCRASDAPVDMALRSKQGMERFNPDMVMVEYGLCVCVVVIENWLSKRIVCAKSELTQLDVMFAFFRFLV